MKKLFFALFGSALLLSAYACDNTNANENTKKSVVAEKATSEKQAANKKGTVHLTKEMFLKQVMDYEKNPQEWKYLGDKPAVIDFYADWCRPCKMVAPVMEELAMEYDGEVVIYKIDTQKEQELAAMFGIQSIPAFLFIPMQGKPQMSSGIAQTTEETKVMFKGIIDDFLLGKGKK
jgi:thioredoxin